MSSIADGTSSCWGVLRLLQILTQDEDQFLAEGKQEVEEMREELYQEGKIVEGEPPTVGPLKES